MAKRPLILCLLLFVIPLLQAEDSAFLRVKRVVDGDTLLLSNKQRVRMIGIDTPEVHKSKKLKRDAERSHRDEETIQKLGERSKKFTTSLVEGKLVTLEMESANKGIKNKDKYGRVLAYVHFTPLPCEELEPNIADNVCDLDSYGSGFLNALIIEAGYAKAYTRFPFRYKDKFVELENKARQEERGLWAISKKLSRLIQNRP